MDPKEAVAKIKNGTLVFTPTKARPGTCDVPRHVCHEISWCPKPEGVHVKPYVINSVDNLIVHLQAFVNIQVNMDHMRDSDFVHLQTKAINTATPTMYKSLTSPFNAMKI